MVASTSSALVQPCSSNFLNIFVFVKHFEQFFVCSFEQTSVAFIIVQHNNKEDPSLVSLGRRRASCDTLNRLNLEWRQMCHRRCHYKQEVAYRYRYLQCCNRQRPSHCTLPSMKLNLCHCRVRGVKGHRHRV